MSFVRSGRFAVPFCLMAGLFTVPARAQVRWDMPTPYPATNFHTQNIQQFIDDVEKAAPNKLKITLHPNGNLFKANEIKRAVQGGQAQIGEAILSSLANEDLFFAIDTLPFVASSYADAKHLLQVTRPQIEQRFAKQGLKVLFSVPWQPQGLYAKTSLSSLADAKGLKIRSYSPTVARLIQLMGALPVTVQAAELSQALATGVVSANFTSSATGYDSKSWEQLSYFIDVQAWLPKNAVFVSQKAFDALDKPTQEAVLKAAAVAEERGWKLSQEKNQWYLDQLQKNTMKVLPPSATLNAELHQIGVTMLREWAEQVGTDGAAVLASYGKK